MMGCIQVLEKGRVLVFERWRSKEQKISPLSSCKTCNPLLRPGETGNRLMIRTQNSLRQNERFHSTLKRARQRRRVSSRNVHHREGNAQNQHRAHERGNRSVRKPHDSSPSLIANMVSGTIVATSGQPAKWPVRPAKNFGWGNASVVMSVPSLSYVICCLCNLNVVSQFEVAFHN
jgi:hypothetical protein